VSRAMWPNTDKRRLLMKSITAKHYLYLTYLLLLLLMSLVMLFQLSCNVRHGVDTGAPDSTARGSDASNEGLVPGEYFQ